MNLITPHNRFHVNLVLSILLGGATLYSAKKRKSFNELDLLFVLLLAAMYYFLLDSLDTVKIERFEQPGLEDGDDEEDDEEEDHLHFPLPDDKTDDHDHVEKTHHIAEHTHLAPEHTHLAPEKTTFMGLPVVKESVHPEHKNKKEQKAHVMNKDKRPSTTKHTMSAPVPGAVVDAPISINIDFGEGEHPVNDYNNPPAPKHRVNPQFDTGLLNDRITQLEHQMEAIANRPLDNQYSEQEGPAPAEESGEVFPLPLDGTREHPRHHHRQKHHGGGSNNSKCPVCPTVLEKPWSEWMDSSGMKDDGTPNYKWNEAYEGMRGGNNPLPVLP